MSTPPMIDWNGKDTPKGRINFALSLIFLAAATGLSLRAASAAIRKRAVPRAHAVPVGVALAVFQIACAIDVSRWATSLFGRMPLSPRVLSTMVSLSTILVAWSPLALFLAVVRVAGVRIDGGRCRWRVLVKLLSCFWVVLFVAQAGMQGQVIKRWMPIVRTGTPDMARWERTRRMSERSEILGAAVIVCNFIGYLIAARLLVAGPAQAPPSVPAPTAKAIARVLTFSAISTALLVLLEHLVYLPTQLAYSALPAAVRVNLISYLIYGTTSIVVLKLLLRNVHDPVPPTDEESGDETIGEHERFKDDVTKDIING